MREWRRKTLLNFLVGPSTRMKNLGSYGSEVFSTQVSLSSMLSLLPFAGKHSFYCAIQGTDYVQGASSVAGKSTKPYKNIRTVFLPSHKQITTTLRIPRRIRKEIKLLIVSYTL